MKIIYTIVLSFLFWNTAVNAQIITKQEKGYFNITTLAEPQYLQSIDSSDLNNGYRAYVKTMGISFSTINGYFPNPNLSMGLGVGVQFSRYKSFFVIPPTLLENTKAAVVDNMTDAQTKQSIVLFPIFADFRYYPSDYRNDLMFILDAGYAPVIKIKNKLDKPNLNGGPLIKLGAGYKIELSESISFVPTINFNAQRFGDNTILGASLGLGLMF